MEQKQTRRGVGRRVYVKQRAAKDVQNDAKNNSDPDPNFGVDHNLEPSAKNARKKSRSRVDSDEDFIKGSSESDSESGSDADMLRARLNNTQHDSDDEEDTVGY